MKNKFLKLSITRSMLGYCSCKGCKAIPGFKLFIFPINKRIYRDIFPDVRLRLCEAHAIEAQDDQFCAIVKWL